MVFGVFNKVLKIDLSNESTEVIKISDDIYQQYLGGIGLGVHLLYQLQQEGADPLGPQNHLGFFPGLLSGTSSSFSGRYMVVTRSPLTLGWGDSNSGGFFGPEIKYAGWDGIIFVGAAKNPIFVSIKDDNVEFHNAKDLWGLDAPTTEKRIKEKLKDRRTQVATIGVAGEKKSLISGIVTDRGRIAARSGVGAVMGSKNLKAVAVRGTQRPKIYDRKKLAKIKEKYLKKSTIVKKKMPSRVSALQKLTKKLLPLYRVMKLRLKPPLGLETMYIVHSYKKWGTTFYTPIAIYMGDAPTMNWKGIGYIDFPLQRGEKIDGDHLLQYQIKDYACRACPVACGGEVENHNPSDPDYYVEHDHRPEYETMSMFGSNIMNDNIEAILKINEICNKQGLDTISTGATVAFAIECFEEGLLTLEDTNGLHLKWGNHKAAYELVKMIVNREGLGNILADGVKRAAEQIGGKAHEFAMHVGGQEVPAHDPKFDDTLGLAYELEASPGRHTKGNRYVGEFTGIHKFIPKYIKKESKKYHFYRAHHYYSHVVDSSGLCEFGTIMGVLPIREWINATTGWSLSFDDLFIIGERIFTLRYMFTLREGINPLRDYKLPPRIRGDPPYTHKKGPLKGKRLPLDQMKREFLRECQWDPQTGLPTETVVQRLGLSKEWELLKKSKFYEQIIKIPEISSVY